MHERFAALERLEPRGVRVARRSGIQDDPARHRRPRTENDAVEYEERIETVLATPREAELLETTTAMPMLRLNRRSLDTDEHPIEVVRSLYRGDRVAFEALLTDR